MTLYGMRTCNEFKNYKINSNDKHELFWKLPEIEAVGMFAFLLGESERDLTADEGQIEPDGKDYRYIFEINPDSLVYIRNKNNTKFEKASIIEAHRRISNNQIINEIIINRNDCTIVRIYKKEYTPNGYIWKEE
jgi:hypothetical protein